MGEKHAKKPGRNGKPRPASPPQGPTPAPRTKKESTEPAEGYSDPICVCEPEPYWQEIAERLKLDS